MMDKRILLFLTLPGIFGLIFILFKLFKVIGWSWLWILSPFWISFFVFGLTLIICVKKLEKERK